MPQVLRLVTKFGLAMVLPAVVGLLYDLSAGVSSLTLLPTPCSSSGVIGEAGVIGTTDIPLKSDEPGSEISNPSDPSDNRSDESISQVCVVGVRGSSSTTICRFKFASIVVRGVSHPES